MASVRKHGNKWQVRWRTAGGRTGDQQVQSFATEREAEDFAKRVEAQTIVDGKPPEVDPDAMTLAQWWSRWEPGRSWSDSSRRQHTSRWSRWIKPVFGHVGIDAIRVVDVERFRATMVGEGLAPLTVRHVLATFAQLLQGAVDSEVIARNPVRLVKSPGGVTNTPVALDAPTTAALLDAIAAAKPELECFARFIAATGVRRGEAAGLCWSQVDLAAGSVTIDRQSDNHGGFMPTKTKRDRTVPLTAGMVAMLREHKRQQVASITGDALVFPSPGGGQWELSMLARTWKAAVEALERSEHPVPAGAKGWHTLRHTVASRLLEGGVPPAEAAAMLGHNADVLLRTYAHVTNRQSADERLRAALEQ
jgi:integrase